MELPDHVIVEPGHPSPQPFRIADHNLHPRSARRRSPKPSLSPSHRLLNSTTCSRSSSLRCPPPARTNPATSHTDPSRPNSSRPSLPPAIPSSPSPPGPSPDDNQILHLDIPTLGVNGVCLLIMDSSARAGAWSFFSFTRGLRTVPQGRREERPGTARRRLRRRGHPLSPSTTRPQLPGDDAYPVVARRDPGGIPRPLGGRDVETGGAAARALSAFLPKHAAIFKADSFAHGCESYFDDENRSPARCATSSTSTTPRIRIAAPDHRVRRKPSSPPSQRRSRTCPASQRPPGLTPRAGSSGARAPL